VNLKIYHAGSASHITKEIHAATKTLHIYTYICSLWRLL